MDNTDVKKIQLNSDFTNDLNVCFIRFIMQIAFVSVNGFYHPEIPNYIMPDFFYGRDAVAI